MLTIVMVEHILSLGQFITTEVAMELTTRQTDRTAGVLLGQACGDALGVPYEFSAPPVSDPEMRGGGLGPYAPGEWSDDTQMAVCIARVAATGADLGAPDALDQVAAAFLDWFDGGATDVGTQTRHVITTTLGGPGGGPLHAVMTDSASELYERTGRAAGNGALMRTAIVGLSALTNRDATAHNARAIAELTHADPLAGDSCVIWSELVRRAVLTGEIDAWGTLSLLPTERRGQWAQWVRDAIDDPEPKRHSHNGFTVVALQAALAAVVRANRSYDGPRAVRAGLNGAVLAGDDTDTVAAIAGGLLGALHGASSVPAEWRRIVHGWPGIRARDLVRLAVGTARGGLDDRRWPATGRMPYAGQGDAQRALAVPHPHDREVLIGTMADLARTRELGVDAVVSLCRLGTDDAPAAGVRPGDHVEMWLLDSERPEDNPHLDAVLDDAAATIESFRSEGKRVLVHCVAAQQRAPSVAARYAVRRGIPRHVAEADLKRALPRIRGAGLLWRTALGTEVPTATKGP
ncbi:ADP-ribosylglycohydrolase family protein [Knoellia sp. CPCC 206450]|uniref:ADP-ribosylglycohydrolase family protein n=1 Tax=Knoellia tibetensis TaxID=3404798 RepID=UPI003B427909